MYVRTNADAIITDVDLYLRGSRAHGDSFFGDLWCLTKLKHDKDNLSCGAGTMFSIHQAEEKDFVSLTLNWENSKPTTRSIIENEPQVKFCLFLDQ